MEILIWFGGLFKKFIFILREAKTPFGISMFDLNMGLASVIICVELFINMTNTMRTEKRIGDHIRRKEVNRFVYKATLPKKDK